MVPLSPTRSRRRSRLLFAVACLLACLALSAHSAPVRLAIIVENPSLSTAAELITAELSHDPDIGLLEHDKIGAVLQEQGLSANLGANFVKLGEFLGADGLLYLGVVSRETNQVVTTRLAAVKPGVVLDLAEYPFPLPEVDQWSRLLVQRLRPLLPKLGVLTRDAIPISFLNIRAAVKSTDGETLERQLSEVLFQRLVHQPEVFVLERRRLQEFMREKDLKGFGNEPFWNGSYLLEGTIDKSGFEAGMITISARLTPPGQKTPIDIEVAGPRKEAASLTSTLGTKLLARLKVQTNIQDWRAQDEAQRYLTEAKWAWKWSMVPEALVAADAAWALGSKDLDCGTMRINAATALAIHQTPLEQQRRLQRAIFTPSAAPPPPRIPQPKDIEMAIRALSNFSELSEALPQDEPKLDSPAFGLAIETLGAISRLLQPVRGNFDLANQLDELLVELRSRLRDLAGWISSSPSVRAAYWPSTGAPIREPFQGKYDLILCETEHARFWHERPEDCLPFYRQMMASPTFALIHDRFYFADTLSAWTAQDKQRAPTVWSNFVQELCLSTNPLLRVEGRIFAFAQIPGPGLAISDAAAARRDAERRRQAIETVVSELMATNPVPLAGASPYRIAPRIADALVRPYGEISSEYQGKRDALDQDISVQEQKVFLASDTLFVFTNIAAVFRHRNYTPEQAGELQPLVVAYKSNLLAVLQERQNLRQADGVTWGSMLEIENVEGRIRQALGLTPLPAVRQVFKPSRTGGNSPTNRPLVRSAGPNTSTPPKNPNSNSVAPLAGWPASTSRQMRLTDDQRAEALIMTARFHRIPMQGIKPRATNVTNWLNAPPLGPFRVAVEGHRVLDGKIWFDIRYGYALDRNCNGGVAVWDPKTRSPVVSSTTMTNGWRIIPYPSRDSSWQVAFGGWADEAVNGVHFELFKGALYLSVWHQTMQRYHLETGVW